MSSTAAFAILAGVLGAVVGSFINVVVYRLPRGESLISPPSRCPQCASPIKPYDNVPVFGWIWLRGRCRACHASISVRYPLVEATSAALCVAVVLARPTLTEVLLGIILVLILIPVALIDLEHHIIPNRITAPAALTAVALGSALNLSGEPERLIAGVAAGGVFLVIAIISPRGMGMGDVKLAGVLGLFLGREVAPAIFAALIIGAVVGIVVLSRTPTEKRRGAGLPFGPFLAIGGVFGLFVGHAVVGAYLHHLG
jgi:leader peptidase (prepilin peptidase) / N-methyltransferase